VHVRRSLIQNAMRPTSCPCRGLVVMPVQRPKLTDVKAPPKFLCLWPAPGACAHSVGWGNSGRRNDRRAAFQSGSGGNSLYSWSSLAQTKSRPHPSVKKRPRNSLVNHHEKACFLKTLRVVSYPDGKTRQTGVLPAMNAFWIIGIGPDDVAGNDEPARSDGERAQVRHKLLHCSNRRALRLPSVSGYAYIPKDVRVTHSMGLDFKSS
jgi:hypothetical protein